MRRPPDKLKELRLKPDAAFFCAMRVWDHGAESGYMKENEDKFQSVAQQVISIRQSLIDDQHDIVTDFFALWGARANAKANPITDRAIPGIWRRRRNTPSTIKKFLKRTTLDTSTKT